jgi:hypothetical protein
MCFHINRSAAKCSALQSSAGQSKSGWQLATAALPMCFRIERNEKKRHQWHRKASQRIAKHPGLGIGNSALARSF